MFVQDESSRAEGHKNAESYERLSVAAGKEMLTAARERHKSAVAALELAGVAYAAAMHEDAFGRRVVGAEVETERLTRRVGRGALGFRLRSATER